MGTVRKSELIERLNRMRQEIDRIEKELEAHEFAEEGESADRFWASFGSWVDDRTAEEIINDLRSSWRSRAQDVSL